MIDRTPFSGGEYRRGLTCMSSRTRSHDVVFRFREAKIESSKAEGGISPKRREGLFLKNGTKWRGFGETYPFGSPQIFKNQAGLDRPQGKMSERDTIMVYISRRDD